MKEIEKEDILEIYPDIRWKNKWNKKEIRLYMQDEKHMCKLMKFNIHWISSTQYKNVPLSTWIKDILYKYDNELSLQRMDY